MATAMAKLAWRATCAAQGRRERAKIGGLALSSVRSSDLDLVFEVEHGAKVCGLQQLVFMARGRRVAQDTLAQAETLFNAGRSTPEVAGALGVSRSTAQRYANRLRKEGKLDTPVSKGGRPKKLDQRRLRYLRREAIHGKSATRGDLLRWLLHNHGIKVSKTTITKVLRKMKVISCVKRKRALLKKMHFKRRYLFAKAHRSWTYEQWAKVLFSDETRVKTDGSDGPRTCFRVRGAPLRPRDVTGCVAHGGRSLMVWGCFTSQGVGKCAPLMGSVNTEAYLSICGPLILASIWDRWGIRHSECTFQQDNARPHISRPAMAWFREHGITLMDWPASSPDLNPIEHLWREVKKRVYMLPRPANLDELWAQFVEEWQKTSPEYCKALVESMPRRMAAVLAAHGGYTKY